MKVIGCLPKTTVSALLAWRSGPRKGLLGRNKSAPRLGPRDPGTANVFNEAAAVMVALSARLLLGCGPKQEHVRRSNVP